MAQYGMPGALMDLDVVRGDEVDHLVDIAGVDDHFVVVANKPLVLVQRHGRPPESDEVTVSTVSTVRASAALTSGQRPAVAAHLMAQDVGLAVIPADREVGLVWRP